MKTLIAAMLCGSALAYASPDFTPSPPPSAVDPDLTASDGTREIEPDTMVTFALASDQLDSMATSQVREVARWLKANPRQNVVLQGHTDRTGSYAYNLALSKGRAQQVRDALVQRGIAANRIVMAAYGERDASRGENELDRRVVIFASLRSPDALAASVLASTKANEVTWTSPSGGQLEERPGH
jgi:outer membrane protein OmpA-like peptidoglycan-associated protein